MNSQGIDPAGAPVGLPVSGDGRFRFVAIEVPVDALDDRTSNAVSDKHLGRDDLMQREAYAGLAARAASGKHGW